MSNAPEPNHSLDGESQSGAIIAASIVLVAVSSFLMALRLYTRTVILKAAGPDDYTAAIAQVLAIGTSIGTVLQARNGLGKHTWTVDADSGTRQLQALYGTILVYNPAQIVLKMSLLLLFRRLFTGEWTQRACIGLFVFIAVWGVTQELLAGLACIPLSLIVPGMADHCIDTLPIWYLTSVMNLVTDFIVFAVPIPSILKLQLNNSRKVFLVCLFCLGFFTCIISIIRLFTLRVSIETTDPMWDNSGTSYWSVIELNCGLMCATLPTLRPLLSKLFPARFMSQITHRYGSGGEKTTNSTALQTFGGGVATRKGGDGMQKLDDEEDGAGKGKIDVRREFDLSVSDEAKLVRTQRSESSEGSGSPWATVNHEEHQKKGYGTSNTIEGPQR